MKSLPFGNLGNVNIRGKKTMRFTDDTAQNFKKRELIKMLEDDKHRLIETKINGVH